MEINGMGLALRRLVVRIVSTVNGNKWGISFPNGAQTVYYTFQMTEEGQIAQFSVVENP